MLFMTDKISFTSLALLLVFPFVVSGDVPSISDPANANVFVEVQPNVTVSYKSVDIATSALNVYRHGTKLSLETDSAVGYMHCSMVQGVFDNREIMCPISNFSSVLCLKDDDFNDAEDQGDSKLRYSALTYAVDFGTTMGQSHVRSQCFCMAAGATFKMKSQRHGTGHWCFAGKYKRFGSRRLEFEKW